MAEVIFFSYRKSLSNLYRYVTDPVKTRSCPDGGESRRLVSYVACPSDGTARAMTNVQSHFGKTGGVRAEHIVIVFNEKDSVTPELAHAAATETASSLWGKEWQCVIATHTDKPGRLHSHIMMNPVSYRDGSKSFWNISFPEHRRRIAGVMERNGIAVSTERRLSSSYARQAMLEKSGFPGYPEAVKHCVDIAAGACADLEDMLDILADMGISSKVSAGKLLLMPATGEYPIDLSQRFDGYTVSGIRSRIASREKVLHLGRFVQEPARTLFDGIRRAPRDMTYPELLTVIRRVYGRVMTKPEKNRALFYLMLPALHLKLMGDAFTAVVKEFGIRDDRDLEREIGRARSGLEELTAEIRRLERISKSGRTGENEDALRNLRDERKKTGSSLKQMKKLKETEPYLRRVTDIIYREDFRGKVEYEHIVGSGGADRQDNAQRSGDRAEDSGGRGRAYRESGL